tara:strand:+ start:7201 stop:7596 length:396 start_codon:yes stop_codon:yes gene_type:complete
MAHFAKLDGNEVTDIVVVDDNDIVGADGNESEAVGIVFLKDMFGQDTVWKQTSWNYNFRKNYAMIGGTYDADKDAFIAIKPFPSWSLNEETCKWAAPVPMPDNALVYWDEDNQKWVEFEILEGEPDLGEKP